MYMVEDLQFSSAEAVRATLLFFYSEILRPSVVPPKCVDVEERTEAHLEMVHGIIDIGKADDGIFLRVQGKWLFEEQEWTWQALGQLYEDVPDMVTSFIHSHKSNCRLLLKARCQLSL